MSELGQRIIRDLEDFLKDPSSAKVSTWETAPEASLDELRRIADGLPPEDRTHLLIAIDELKRYTDAVRWALGFYDFRPQREGEGRYWWRKELRARVELARRVDEPGKEAGK